MMLTDNPAIPFFKGWCSLPDEIKLQILRHTLPSNDTYSYERFRKWSFVFEKNHRDDFRELVIPLLSVPALYGMVLEALYSQNTMYIKKYVIEGSRKLPRVGVRHHVRLLELHASEYAPSMLGFLWKFAATSTPFQNLQTLAIDFDGDINEDGKLKTALKSMAPMKFPVRILTMKYRHAVMYKTFVEGYGIGFFGDDLEMPLLCKFSIVGNSAGVTEKWERYCTTYDGSKVVVQAWPGVVRNIRQRYTRKTVSLANLIVGDERCMMTGKLFA
jgi:hypothetical protein